MAQQVPAQLSLWFLHGPLILPFPCVSPYTHTHMQFLVISHSAIGEVLVRPVKLLYGVIGASCWLFSLCSGTKTSLKPIIMRTLFSPLHLPSCWVYCFQYAYVCILQSVQLAHLNKLLVNNTLLWPGCLSWDNVKHRCRTRSMVGRVPAGFRSSLVRDLWIKVTI